MANDDLAIQFGAQTSGLVEGINQAQAKMAAITTTVSQAKSGFDALTTSLQQAAGSGGSFGALATATEAVDKKFGGLDAKIIAVQNRLAGFKASAIGGFMKGQTASIQSLIAEVTAAGSLKNFAALSGGALGVGLIGVGFAAQAAETLDKLRQLADQAGVTTSQMQGLQSVFGRLGLSSDQTSKLLVNLESNLLNAKANGGALRDALTAAGISFQEANGDLKPTIETLQELVDKFRATKDASANTSLAAKAFGDELGGQFVTAVGKGVIALGDLKKAAHSSTSSIIDDVSAMVEKAIRTLASLWQYIDQLYSEAKQTFGAPLSGQDQTNIAALNLDSARDALADAQKKSLTGPETEKAWKDFFAAGAAVAKTNPIPVLQGGYPTKAKAPAATPDTSDDDSGGDGRASRAAAKEAERAGAIIQKLQEELALATSVGAAHRAITDQLKTQKMLKEAGVTAMSAEGKAIADLVAKVDAANAALKQQKAIASEVTKEFEKIGSTISNSLMGILEKTTTIRGLFQSLAKSLVAEFLQANLKIAADTLAKIALQVAGYETGQAAMTASATAGIAERASAAAAGYATEAAGFLARVAATIEADAAQAFAGVTAFLAPVLGPAAVGPAAGVEATVIAAGAALPALATGSWSLPSDMIAQVHQGEMIVPASQTPWAQSLMSNAAVGGGGGGVNLTINHTTYGRRNMQEIEAETEATARLLMNHMGVNRGLWQSALGKVMT